MLTKYFKHSLVALTIVALLPCFGHAVETKNPLADFEWMLGGEWKSGSTIQLFEWGLDQRTVKASSYVLSGDERVLASEGFWFWHPQDKVIKGFFVAKGMPFYMIESEAEFDGRKFIHRLKTYSENDDPQRYVEVIEPKSGDVFSWQLFAGESIGGKPLMSERFQRIS